MLSPSDTDSLAAGSIVRKPYLTWCVLNLVLLLGVVAGFNLVVDPEARFLIVNKPGFNFVKTGLATNSRKGKVNALRQCDYDTLVLGASSAETGITQQHPVMRDKKFYNAALRGGSMYEMRRMVEYALEQQDLKIVLLGLDFSTFNSRVVFLEDFADSPLSETTPVDSLARYLFSLRTFINSAHTVKLNAQGDAEAFFCSDNGEHKRTYEIEEARKAFDFILGSYARDQFSTFVAGDLHYRHLAALLQELRASNVAVYAFISPTHVLQRELITEMDLLDEYEDWKRQLAQVFAEVNRNAPEQWQAVLWDFSGYNFINTERIPSGDGGGYLQWYSDPVHFNQSVGNFVLDRMLGLPSDILVATSEFGVLVTPENVEAIIEEERRDSERYRRDNATEIVHLQNLLLRDSGNDVPGSF